MSPPICLSLQNAKVKKEHNSQKINLIFFKADQVISPNNLTKCLGPSSNSYRDILFKRLKYDERLEEQHKGNTSLQLFRSFNRS